MISQASDMLSTFWVIFLITVVCFCVGAYGLLALLRWLAADRAHWVPQDRRSQRLWHRFAGCWHLSAFWGGVLAILADTSVMLYAYGPHGVWAALAVSILSGWVNPDDLSRYVVGVLAGIAAVQLPLMVVLGLPAMRALTLLTPISIALVVAAGATLFMAGAVVRRITE